MIQKDADERRHDDSYDDYRQFYPTRSHIIWWCIDSTFDGFRSYSLEYSDVFEAKNKRKLPRVYQTGGTSLGDPIVPKVLAAVDSS